MILFEAKNQSCHAILKKIDNKLELSLYGRLDVHSLASLWQPLLHALHSASLSNPITCHVNLTNVDYLDLSGATFLEAIRSFTPIQTQETGLDSRFLPLRKIAPPLPNPLNFSAQRQHSSTISLLGSHVLHILDDLRQQLTFSGKLLKILLSAFICPNSIRWRETLLIFRKCGSDALLIVSLISLLMGMILAFQSAIP
ncbi:MAG: STAS domain-containing protein, partial [Chthoniobacterales bacterium]|nr:STAS domain-containing protein [Chthoniobacterales bacterium]